MLRIITLSLIALFFVGCTSGSLTSINLAPNSGGVSFKAAECQSQLGAKYLRGEQQSGRISVKRSFYQIEDNIFVYERGRLDDNFVFSVSLDSLVHFAFELKKQKTSSLGNFHTYFEGISRTGKPVYIIAAGFGVFESFELFYSDSEYVIKELASCVRAGGEREAVLGAFTADIPTAPLDSYIRSDFSAALFFKYDIISSKGNGERYLSR